MTPAERLQLVRRALGASAADMAEVLGISGDRAEDTVREMERGSRSISGAIERVLEYMGQAIEIGDPAAAEAGSRALPRWLDCSDLEDESEAEIVLHTRYPRFYASFVDDLSAEAATQLSGVGVDCVRLPEDTGLGWLVVFYIDQPVADTAPLIDECARLKIAQARRDLR